jgi:RHS repeat-associated protein
MGVDPYRDPFTGKELDSETSLQYFGARYYMAALGRWGAVDPLADQYAGHSPYNYVLGNPNSLVDPDGMAPADCCRKLLTLASKWRSGWATGVRRVVGDAWDTFKAGPAPLLDAVRNPVETVTSVAQRVQQDGSAWAQNFSAGDAGDRTEMVAEVAPTALIVLIGGSQGVRSRLLPRPGRGRAVPNFELEGMSAADIQRSLAERADLIQPHKPGVTSYVLGDRRITLRSPENTTSRDSWTLDAVDGGQTFRFRVRPNEGGVPDGSR